MLLNSQCKNSMDGYLKQCPPITFDSCFFLVRLIEVLEPLHYSHWHGGEWGKDEWHNEFPMRVASWNVWGLSGMGRKHIMW